MKIGKQSTLNDLGDLQKDLEAKIEEAKAIKVSDVAQIESGYLVGGALYVQRPQGIYGVYNMEGAQGGGMMITSSHISGGGWAAGIYVNHAGDVKVFSGLEGVEEVTLDVLTSKNTITDSNGFIKAA